MPLKPMFSRAPLTRQPLAPLAPEGIRLTGIAGETLERLCSLALQAPMSAALADGALTCAGGKNGTMGTGTLTNSRTGRKSAPAAC